MVDITDAMVDAAWAVLREEWESPYRAYSGNYINGPDDPPQGPERDAALAALRAADSAAEDLNRDSIRRALVAALSASEPQETP